MKLIDQAYTLYILLERERRVTVSKIIVKGGTPNTPELNRRRQRLQQIRDRAYARFKRRGGRI